jgi:hypothetical protein
MRHHVKRGSDWRRWALVALVALALGLGPGSAFAEDDDVAPPPVEESPPPPGADREDDSGAVPSDGSTPPPSDVAPPPTEHPGRFVSEVIDSTYFVEPAEFFAIDLPVNARGGKRAVHLLGDVTVLSKRDIIVRMFRSSDYQDWLKRRGGRAGKPFWTSPRSRTIHIDQDLPAGVGVVLLIDNGYSLRTPKRVRLQLQMQYEGPGGAVEATMQQAPPPQEGDITPRSNVDDEFAPPPPPPPEEGKN